jgi:hypothetical protein
VRDLARLAGFLAAVVVVFGLAFGVGRAVGPVGETPTPSTDHPTTVTSSPMTGHESSPVSDAPAGAGSHAGSHPSTTSTTSTTVGSNARPTASEGGSR